MRPQSWADFGICLQQLTLDLFYNDIYISHKEELSVKWLHRETLMAIVLVTHLFKSNGHFGRQGDVWVLIVILLMCHLLFTFTVGIPIIIFMTYGVISGAGIFKDSPLLG